MIQKVHMDYNERREVGFIIRRPSSEGEVRKKFLLTGWATIHSLSEHVSMRQLQQVLMEFLENPMNITSDFHRRLGYLTTFVSITFLFLYLKAAWMMTHLCMIHSWMKIHFLSLTFFNWANLFIPREPGLEETCAVIRRKEWSDRLLVMRDILLKYPICFREYEVERFFHKHLLDKHKLKQCIRFQDYFKVDALLTYSCLQVVMFFPESVCKDEEVAADEDLSNAKCSSCPKTFESGFQLEVHMLETQNLAFLDGISLLHYDRSVSFACDCMKGMQDKL